MATDTPRPVRKRERNILHVSIDPTLRAALERAGERERIPFSVLARSFIASALRETGDLQAAP